MTICYLAIGSNLGDRRRNIRLAVQKISHLKNTEVIKLSKVLETEPIDGPSRQGRFLNAALRIETLLSPSLLLKKLKKIEQELGRPGKHIRNSPRSIDLDILFFGDRVINRKYLKVPHPKLFERQFVIKPLLEVI